MKINLRTLTLLGSLSLLAGCVAYAQPAYSPPPYGMAPAAPYGGYGYGVAPVVPVVGIGFGGGRGRGYGHYGRYRH